MGYAQMRTAHMFTWLTPVEQTKATDIKKPRATIDNAPVYNVHINGTKEVLRENKDSGSTENIPTQALILGMEKNTNQTNLK